MRGARPKASPPMNSVVVLGRWRAFPQARAQPYAAVYADDPLTRGLAAWSGAATACAAAAGSTPWTCIAATTPLLVALPRRQRRDVRRTLVRASRPCGRALRSRAPRASFRRRATVVATLTGAARWRWFRPSKPLVRLCLRSSSARSMTRSCARLKAAGCDARLARIYAARGLAAMDELSTTLQSLVPPQSLHRIDEAARCSPTRSRAARSCSSSPTTTRMAPPPARSA